MTDRVPSDHPSVTTVRATLARAGRLDRPVVEIPGDSAVSSSAGDVVRIVMDDHTYHAQVESQLTGDGVAIKGVYDTPAMARERDGENRLTEWHASTGMGFGGSVMVDEIEPGFAYGLREPGTHAVYESVGSPDDSLSSIAESLGEE